MAAPSYTEDLTDIDLAETTGPYEAVGGGGAGLSADPDFAIQVTNSITKQVSNARKGILFDNGTGISIPAGDHIYVWIYCTTPGLLDTLAVGGLCVSIGNATNARNEFHVVGAAEYAQGGWPNVPINYVTTSSGSHPYRTLVGSPSGNPQFFGVIADTTDTVKAVNTSVDVMRYGTGAYITAGEVADPATFEGFATQNDNTSNRWGILTAIDGGFSLQGRFVVGQNNSQTPTLAYFEDANTLVVLADTFHSTTDFTQIIVDHASTTFNMTGVSVLALGTNNPGRLVYNNASTTSALTSCNFTGIGISTLRAGVTASGCVWTDSEKVTANEADVNGSSFLTSAAAAGDAALQWDETLTAAKTLAKLDNTSFSQGTAAHHAITFGTGVDENITLTGCDFTGFASGDDVDGSVFEFLATSGSLNLNLVGCTTDDTFSVDDSAGITVTVVIDPVATKVTVQDSGDAPLQNARVFLETGDDGTTGFPYQDAVTSLTQSAGVATLTSTGLHGLDTGDKVVVRGAQPDDYNKVAAITVTTTSIFTYAVDSGIAATATGTPVYSYVAVHGLTDINGEITASKTWPAPQSLTGWARLTNATSPFYAQAPIAIPDASGGTDLLTTLPDDE